MSGTFEGTIDVVVAAGWLWMSAAAAVGFQLDFATGRELTLTRELVGKVTDTYKFSLNGGTEVSFTFSELGNPACMMEIIQLPIRFPLYRFDPQGKKAFSLVTGGEYQLIIYQTMSAAYAMEKCTYEIKVNWQFRK